MKELLKKYYLYIIIGVIVIISTILSMDFEKNDENIAPTLVNEQEVNKTYIYIDIRGAVLNPGVYKVESGTRLFQLVLLSGGFTDEVNDTIVNQSILLTDEMFVYIPTIYDDEVDIINSNNQDGQVKININTASKNELETLSGIGPTTAQKIIDYRDSNGPFHSIEDIVNVPGIGETIFNEIESFITV